MNIDSALLAVKNENEIMGNGAHASFESNLASFFLIQLEHFSSDFFYGRFVFYEKLKPEDRKRTHILSSFFYKRLTQRNNSLDNHGRLVEKVD